MIAGQYPIEYVYPNYAYAYYAPLPNEINCMISPPVSQQQTIGQINRNLNIIFDQVGDNVKVGVVSINRNAMSLNSVSDSVLLLIDDPSRFYYTRKYLNFTIKIPYYSTNEVNITYPLESVQFPCKKGIFENFDYECSNGYINRIDCDGTAGMYSIICVNKFLQKCKLYEESLPSSNNASNHLSCESITYKTDSSECRCSFNTQYQTKKNSDVITFQIESIVSNFSGSIVNYKPTFFNSYAIAGLVLIYFSSFWIICILFCTVGRYFYYHHEYLMKSNKKPKDMGEVIFSPTIMKIQEDSSNYFIKNIWNLRFEINTYLHKYLFKNLSKGIYSRGNSLI
jgi:hypothetical protein